LTGVIALAALAGSAAANAQGFNFPIVVRTEPQLTTQLQTVPEAELKHAYSTCSRHAMERVLGSGEAAACSILYETLLSTVFGGDFEALLMWSRGQSNSATEASSADSTPIVRGLTGLQP
jgi:hypothetical protein